MKRNIAIAAVTVLALAAGGTATALAVGSDDRGTSTPATGSGSVSRADVVADSGSGSTTVSAAAPVSVTDAVDAALKHTPGTVLSVDREDDGAGAWEVDVVKADGTEYEVRVSLDTGAVTGAHRDREDRDDRDDRDDDGRDDDGLSALKGADVSARDAAVAVAGKGTVTEVSLDDDDRTVAWNVETTKGEWTVDLRTGKVTADHDDD
ncbi:PepSY domain-containing protein [Streptomyces sp. NPDC090106]|uniref:PepSY domain-containing protein n=1 Tax=Streptomyces sp. NPDC090106 TaxID=3365946 RepID=UPI00381151FB